SYATSSYSTSFALLCSAIRLPPTSTLFPYTTLFRSLRRVLVQDHQHLAAQPLRLGVAAEQPLAVGIEHGQAVGKARGDFLVQERSEEHTSELQSRENLVCRLLLEKKKENIHCHRTAA